MSLNKQLREIAQTYHPNPFHNWNHGKYVWNTVMNLEKSRSVVTPWRMAWYFHDADHRWFVQEDDEERAAQIAHDTLHKWGFWKDFIDATKIRIMWTVFKERWNLILPEQKLIADADLSKLWSGYIHFVQNSIRYLLETEKKWDISDERIAEFFRIDQPWFFKYLTSISRRPETPFLTPIAQKRFPNFSRNIDNMAKDAEENIWELTSLVRTFEKKPEIKTFRNAA